MILQMQTANQKGLRCELTRCAGTVMAILPGGGRCNARTLFTDDTPANGKPMKLKLQVQRPADYMRLSCFAIGDI